VTGKKIPPLRHALVVEIKEWKNTAIKKAAPLRTAFE
tara:strand:+ start:709 stop:819 length:111 start_codon:yes stop_codon:yes gene_type:complete